MKNNCKTLTLPNNIRVVLQQKNTNVVYCGIMIGAGTSSEVDNENGIAHFLEHVLFKGTKKRSAVDICYGLEREGGELNAYTSREDTVVYAIVQKSEFEKALEMICDLVFNSIFPQSELEKEKGVIISEIDSVNCNLSEVIYDKSMEFLFKNESIGKPIMGTKKSIKSFTSDDVVKFVKRNYVNSSIVLSIVGDIGEDDLKTLSKKYLGRYKNDHMPEKIAGVGIYKPFKKEFSSNSAQAFCSVANRAYCVQDERSVGLSLLTNILGGPIFSSKLNMNLRERNGLVYDISASYEAFSNTGAFQIYFETAKQNLKKSTRLVLEELNNLRSKKISKSELEYAKHRFVGQLAIQYENLEQRMIDNAKMLLMLGRIETFDEQKDKINALNSKLLYEIANDIFDEKKLSFISYS